MALFDTSKGFEACAFYSILEPFYMVQNHGFACFVFALYTAHRKEGSASNSCHDGARTLNLLCASLAALPCCIIAMESFHLLHSSHQKVNPVTKS
jgi:hypothetical protein